MIVEALPVDVPWWLDIPAPVALYGLLWFGFDRLAWRWSIWRHVGIVRAPDYRGSWQLVGHSDFDSGTEFGGTAVVRQTWTRIGIEMETGQSRSHSLTASVLLEPSSRPRLTYQYLNEPKADADVALQAHRGTAWLDLQDDALVGEYYGGRGSKNGGSLRLTRIW